MYTDIPVIKIAMNNGFASVAAFNKLFKETYKMYNYNDRIKEIEKNLISELKKKSFTVISLFI